MRLATQALVLCGLIAFASSSCTTPKDGATDLIYDGTVDSMDSLPDCGPGSLGSVFWVKGTDGGAFECKNPNDWAKRKDAPKPDDADEVETYGDSGPRSPRIVK